jgi:ABC-2 type transport system ATP-binding protein
MKQKLAIARAVLHRPPLVLLDEPTAGLDVMAAVAVRDDLASPLAASEEITIFLTTHNMVEAQRLCAQVAVIPQGKELAVGNPDELRARAGGPQVEVVGKGSARKHSTWSGPNYRLLLLRWRTSAWSSPCGRLGISRPW